MINMDDKYSNVTDELLPIPGEYGESVVRELIRRELGFNGPLSRHNVGRRIVSHTLATKAVHTLCTQREFKKQNFKLPTGARTTFNLAFSPDGTKVASCHGDHNIYICEVTSGNLIQTLAGHPRTPWCIAFHPTQNDVLASGCLGGQVRVWDLNLGLSELLVTDGSTVIASLSFHPFTRLLAIATFNEIIFWDWGLPYPLARCSTDNTKEKVRLVRFDRLGHSLITGITNFPSPPYEDPELTRARTTRNVFYRPNILHQTQIHREPRQPPPGQYWGGHSLNPISMMEEARERDSDPTAEIVVDAPIPAEDIVNEALNERQVRFQESYRQLVTHYQDLVTHYQQFLRGRIPRLLETSRLLPSSLPPDPAIVLDVDSLPPVLSPILVNLSDSDSDQVTSPDEASNDGTPSVDIVLSANPSIQGAASALDSVNPATTPLALELENLISTIPMDTSETNNTVPREGNQNITAGGGSTAAGGDNSFNSIEVLAQNIVEMQNFVRQAGRDAPATNVEGQRIVELQNIRRHLEILQEQTRSLQSSIRDTLSSLARGSLDAIRSRVISTMENADAESVRTGREIPPQILALRARIMESARAGIGEADNSYFSRESVPSPTSRSISPSMPPLTVPRLMVTPEVNSASRSRVPPVLTMQYDFGEEMLPTPTPSRRTGTNSIFNPPNSNSGASNPGNNTNLPNEPMPGPSQNPLNVTLPRRVLRMTDYHVFGERFENEHSRFCPFSGREGNLMRPLPRLRYISEFGLEPILTIWPTHETGQEVATRSFRALNGLEVLDRNYSVEPFTGAQFNRIPPERLNLEIPTVLPSFYHWMSHGPWWVNNDVGVGVYLTVRQFNDRINNLRREDIQRRMEGGSGREQFIPQQQFLLRRARHGTESNSNSSSSDDVFSRRTPPPTHPSNLIPTSELTTTEHTEQWQRFFQTGLGLVPPNVREGQRAAARRRSRTLYTPGSVFYTLGQGYSRPIAMRPSAWDEFRTSMNTPSETNTGSGSETAPSSTAPRRELPPFLPGNFARAYYIRSAEEHIPVYSHMTITNPNGTYNEERELPQPYVYIFPLGLFMRGNEWEGGSMSLGVYYPPTSRDEEDLQMDYRRSENLIPVLTEEEARNFDPYPTPLHRITYDLDSITVYLADETFFLTFIQTGITVLDAVTTVRNWPRPRNTEGTVFITHLAPFLEALERMFSHRMRRTTGHQTGSSRTRSPPPFGVGVGRQIRANITRRMEAQDQPTLRERVERDLEEAFADDWPRRRYPDEIRVHANPFLQVWNQPSASGAPRPDSRPPGTDPYPLPLGAILRNPHDDSLRRRAYQDYTNAVDFMRRTDPSIRLQPINFQGTHDHHHHSNSDSASLASTRRVIRLAVDTAASVVLQRHPGSVSSGIIQQPNIASALDDYQPTITRAIESRIERVLNERGASDLRSDSSSDSTSPSANTTSENTSTGTQTNENSSTGTQTLSSFIRNTLESSTPPIIPASPESPPPTLHTSATDESFDDLRPSQRARRTGGITTRISFRNTTNNDNSSSSLDDRPRRINITHTQYVRNPSSGSGLTNQSQSSTSSSARTSGISTASTPPAANLPPTPSASESSRRRNPNPSRLDIRQLEHSRDGRSLRILMRRRRDHHILRPTPTPENSASASNQQVSQDRDRAAFFDILRLRRRTPNDRNNEEEGVRYTAHRQPMGSVPPEFERRRRISQIPRPTDSVPSVAHRVDAERLVIPSVNPRTGGTASGAGSADNTRRRTAPTARLSDNLGGAHHPPNLARVRPPSYYTIDGNAATTAFLSSRIQKWDFSNFIIPDITKREENVVVRECSLHSDACVDVSSDADFVAVLQPSEAGFYSSVGIYSLRNETLGDILNVYHFDQNTVSVSISPSCNYIVVGYAGSRMPLYRIHHPNRTIGQILCLARDRDQVKLVPVKEIMSQDNQHAFTSINCMAFAPIPGYGIIYGTNTGELVILK